MKQWRVFILAFWIFVGLMLAWQFYSFNNGVTDYHDTHPEKHYFYDPGAIAQAVPKAPAPDVRQSVYRVIPNTPERGSFTVQFAVQNRGNLAATNIQVKVRPYRGILNGDTDNGHAHGTTVVHSSDGGTPRGGSGSVGPISEDDPTSLFGEWVSLPDLAPGESATNSVIFPNQPGKAPNDNPRLEINFEPVKSK